MVIRRFLIKLFFRLQNNPRLRYLDYLNSSSKKTYEELLQLQFQEIQKLLHFSYQQIPFYKYWFDLHKVNLAEITDIETFSQMIPILTKKDIIENFTLFTAPSNIKYVHQSTGGSTGQTLKFRMSKKDQELGLALLLRGMGEGDYKLGDRILILGGGSLVKQSSRISISQKLLNQFKVSSYGLVEKDFSDIVDLLKKKKISYLRGYASSIYLLADYCKNYSVDIPLRAVFTTSELLPDPQRMLIEKTFNCKVYNQYGLNDGGVSAFEYKGESGFVVDMERAFMEISKEDSKDEGTILATALYNYSFPFIRYDTGDRGIMEIRDLKSGVKRPVLTKLLGRETDFLFLNNKKIGSPVLTVLMGATNAEQYRIIQKKQNEIEIQIKKGEKYSEKDEEFIIDSFRHNCGPGLSIIFTYLESFKNTNKHKFIINEFEN